MNFFLTPASNINKLSEIYWTNPDWEFKFCRQLWPSEWNLTAFSQEFFSFIKIVQKMICSELCNYTYITVLRTGGNYIVIERIPFYISNDTAMTINFTRLKINATDFFQGYHHKSGFANDCEKLGIDSAHVSIASISNNTDVGVAGIFFRWHSIHMSKFWWSYTTKPCLKPNSL